MQFNRMFRNPSGRVHRDRPHGHQYRHLRMVQQVCSTRSNGNLRVKSLLPWQQSFIVVQLNLPRP